MRSLLLFPVVTLTVLSCAPPPAAHHLVVTYPQATALALPASTTVTAPAWFSIDASEPGFLALAVDAGHVFVATAPDPGAVVAVGDGVLGARVPAGTTYVYVDGIDRVDGAGSSSASVSLSAALTTPTSLAAAGLGDDVAKDAVLAFENAWERGDTNRFTFAVTDFSLRSSVPREWIFDLASGDLLWNLIVAHGENSSRADDRGFAVAFSNVDGSHKSSLGMMRAGEDYDGTYGHSVRLDGLEPGVNDAVRPRAIVVHPWTGSRPEYVQQYGMAAETWGCPAVDDRVLDDVIAKVGGGGLFFFWYPDDTWRASSPYLQPLD